MCDSARTMVRVSGFRAEGSGSKPECIAKKGAGPQYRKGQVFVGILGVWGN